VYKGCAIVLRRVVVRWFVSVISFTSALDCAGAPPNDLFTDRIPLVGLPVQTSGSNIGAAKQAGEPNFFADSGGFCATYQPVWWSWTSPSNAIVSVIVAMPDRPAIKGEFEIDTGCDSGLCLGHPFVEKNQLLAATETQDSAKFGVGGGASTRSGHVAELRLGRFTVDRPQTDFFVEGSPVSDPFAGHIGMGVLREFKVIFDFSRKQLILER